MIARSSTPIAESDTSTNRWWRSNNLRTWVPYGCRQGGRTGLNARPDFGDSFAQGSREFAPQCVETLPEAGPRILLRQGSGI
jgi:hypothetical protein